MNDEEHQVVISLEKLKQSFRSGRTRSSDWRKTQLRALLRLVQENEGFIFRALDEDLGKDHVEAYRDEVGILVKSLNLTLSNLDQWMATTKTRLPLVFFPAVGEVLPEPLGVVLILSSWNYPISLALDPLIGAIAAGNAVVLKPSELAPACSALLANTIPSYMDDKAVMVVEGGASVGKQLLDQKWDKIFFTGSPRVGRIVMSAAAKHLTPVTLELGGKCPVIVDSRLSPSQMQVAVKRIVGGKWGFCSGQACIGVDYLLVEDKFAPSLIELMKKTIKKFHGDNPKEPKNMARIVNKHHFERLSGLLQDPVVAASIVHGGSLNEEKMTIEPTILLDPPLDAEIMTEEIFGPLLPIITLKSIDDSTQFVNSRPKPLALYAFTNDSALKKRVLAETSSGSVTFNDVAIQFACDVLPFGGVGQSGFGKYHGKYSFDAFSHGKAVLSRTFYLEIEPRYPPWNAFKLAFIRLLYMFDYFGLLLLMTGLKSGRPVTVAVKANHYDDLSGELVVCLVTLRPCIDMVKEYLLRCVNLSSRLCLAENVPVQEDQAILWAWRIQEALLGLQRRFGIEEDIDAEMSDLFEVEPGAPIHGMPFAYWWGIVQMMGPLLGHRLSLLKSFTEDIVDQAKMHNRQTSRWRLIDEEIEELKASISGRDPMDKGSDLEVLNVVSEAPLSMVLPTEEFPVMKHRWTIVTEDSPKSSSWDNLRSRRGLKQPVLVPKVVGDTSRLRPRTVTTQVEKGKGRVAPKAPKVQQSKCGQRKRRRVLGEDDTQEEDEEMTEAERQEQAVAK
ncbi:hypothetical protein GIB67_005066 [Kingdonia uniflora]|uniref:aldehyde dehydrogenase (NAD(+)) n=1 Tax=Kingdonia uniflora TaxID=39325 RepID=A0A7J7P8V1_9MAGN|nr:hypothetical protein GIB67_005066 [Kingdonia uniflora]